MAEKRIISTVFSYIIDKSSLDAAARAQSSVIKLLDETSKQALSVEDAAKKVNRELAEMARQKAIQRIADEFVEATANSDETADALERVSEQLSAIGASDSEIQSVVRRLEQVRDTVKEVNSQRLSVDTSVLDDIERSLQGRRQRLTESQGDISTQLGALGGLAGGGLGEGLRLGGDVFGVLEYFDRFKEGIVEVGSALQQGGGIIGTVASTGAKLGSSLGPVGAGLGSILAVAGPLALATVAVQVGLSLITAELERQAAATQLIIDARKEETQRTLEAENAIRTLSSAENAANMEAKKREIAETQKEIAFLEAQKQDAEQRRNEAAMRGGPQGLLDLVAAQQEMDKYSAGIEDANRRFIDASRDYQQAFANAPKITEREQKEGASEDLTAAQDTLRQSQIEAIDAQIEREKQLQDLIRSGTSEQVNALVQAQEDEIEANNRAIESLKALGVTNEDVAARVDELTARNAELADSNRDLEGIALLQIEAREKETKAAEDHVAAIEQQIANQTRLNDLIRNASFEQLEARKTAIQEERAAILANLSALAAAARESEAGQQAFDAAKERLSELSTDFNLLEKAMPSVAARELTEALGDLDKELAKVRATYDDAVAKADAKLKSSLEELNRNFLSQQTKDRDAAQKKLEEFDYQEERRKEAHRQKLAEIDRRFNASAATAISERNVVAFLSAKQTRDEAKRQENERFTEESKARKHDLELLHESIQEQQRATQAAYAERRAALEQQHRDELQAAYQKYQQEFALRQAAYAQETQQLQNFLNAQIRLYGQAQQQQIGLVSQGMRAIGQAISSVFSQTQRAVLSTAARAVGSLLGGATGSPLLRLASGIRIPGFDTGAVVTQTGLANVHQNELILNERQQQSLGLSRDSLARGGAPNIDITINGLGMSKRQLMAQIDRELSQVVEGFTA